MKNIQMVTTVKNMYRRTTLKLVIEVSWAILSVVGSVGQILFVGIDPGNHTNSVCLEICCGLSGLVGPLDGHHPTFVDGYAKKNLVIFFAGFSGMEIWTVADSEGGMESSLGNSIPLVDSPAFPLLM